MLTLALSCAKRQGGSSADASFDAGGPEEGGGAPGTPDGGRDADAGGSPTPDGLERTDAPAPPDGRPPADGPAPADCAPAAPCKQPVGGTCATATDCESAKCCAGKCIARTTCCDCNTAPRCENGNVLTAACDNQGSCNETIVDCVGRGCNAGKCNVCQPGATECNGSALVTCNASGTGTNPPVECPNGCSAVRRQCNVCQPGRQGCNGVRLDTCKADGSGFDPGNCHPMCLPGNGCCSDLDCGRCSAVYPCRTCVNNRCQMTNSEPSCNTQGTCTPEATEVCRMNGATCEVRKRIDGPCRYQLCRWPNVSLAACGQNGNRGIPTPVCHPVSIANPEMVYFGDDGSCCTQVENITGAPVLCL